MVPLSTRAVNNVSMTVNVRKSSQWTADYCQLHGFIIKQHNDQLPDGLLVQLIEHGIGVAQVMGLNLVRA